MPNNMWENIECWDSLHNLRAVEIEQFSIIVGDFNVTLVQKEKKGGNIVQDPFCERLEDLILEWDLVDINLAKRKFTWSNKRMVPSFISTILDHFLI
jgi:hypothetical protein